MSFEGVVHELLALNDMIEGTDLHWSRSPGVLVERKIPDGRTVHIIEMTFGKGRIGVGVNPEKRGYDAMW